MSTSGLPPRPLFDLDRIIVGTCLVLAAALAWWWLWRQHDLPAMAGMGAGGMDMAGMADMPMPLAPPFGATFLMWALMMVAMMLPSAIPMMMLHAQLMRGTHRPRRQRLAVTAIFALAYLLVWTAASLGFALAQQTLAGYGLITDTRLALSDPAIGGGLLIAAGLYQLTPLKRLCLDRCRSPLLFLMRDWRPSPPGALRLGLRHGLYCLGCCWALMALLFFGGVMDLAWVALLAAVVLVEKLLPGGPIIARAVGAVAVGAGVLVLAGPF